MDTRNKGVKYYICLCISLLLYVFVVILMFFLKFGSGRLSFDISDFSGDPTRWSEFGSYFNGMVGPIVSILAFVALLITISIQNKQYGVALSENKLNKIQSRYTIIAAELSALHEAILLIKDEVKQLNRSLEIQKTDTIESLKWDKHDKLKVMENRYQELIDEILSLKKDESA